MRERELWLWPAETLRGGAWRKLWSVIMPISLLDLLNRSWLGLSIPSLRASPSWTWALEMDGSNVLWRDVLPLLTWSLSPRVHVNSHWCTMVACFAPSIFVSSPGEWSRLHEVWYFCSGQDGSVYGDSWRNGLANLALVALVWSGSIHHMFACGKQLSSVLKGNHREHSVFPTDVETTIGELKQPL